MKYFCYLFQNQLLIPYILRSDMESVRHILAMLASETGKEWSSGRTLRKGSF